MTFFTFLADSARLYSSRFCDICLAVLSDSTPSKGSPADGTPEMPSTSTGVDGTGLVDGLAVVVEHGAHLSGKHADDEWIAHVQRSVLNQDRGHGAPAHVELRFDDGSLGHEPSGSP